MRPQPEMIYTVPQLMQFMQLLCLTPFLQSTPAGSWSRVTKLAGPGGTYCVIEDTVGATGDIDHMQQGVQRRTTSCDHLFD